METWAFPLEIKELTQAGEIVGLAAAFGNIDHGGDRILPGAFAKTLADHRANGTRPAMLLHHDMSRPVGVWKELSETANGLMAVGKLTLASNDGKEAYALARDGALTGLSVGYVIDKASQARDARELAAIKLIEVSLVSCPMNDLARLQTVKQIGGVRDLEELMRLGGFSNRQAKAAASAAWRAINQTDDDEAARAVLASALERMGKL